MFISWKLAIQRESGKMFCVSEHFDLNYNLEKSSSQDLRFKSWKIDLS